MYGELLSSPASTLSLHTDTALKERLALLNARHVPRTSSPLASSSATVLSSNGEVENTPKEAGEPNVLVTSDKAQYPVYICAGGGGALVFDLETMKALSVSTGIAGQLSGVLPIAPQQNSLLGFPWRLSVYETLWLVENGWAVLSEGTEIAHAFVDQLGQDEMLLQELKRDLDCRLDQQREDKRRQVAERLKKFGKENKANSSMPNLSDALTEQKRPQTAVPTSKTFNTGSDIVFMETDNDERRVAQYWREFLPKGAADDDELRLLINKLIEPEVRSLMKTAVGSATRAEACRRFRLQYETFRHLKDQQQMWLLPGMRFGGLFVAYAGDPLRYHSRYIVETRDYYTEDIGIRRLANRGRLATGVKKQYMVCGFKENALLDGSAAGSADGENPVFSRSLAKPVVFTIEWAGF